MRKSVQSKRGQTAALDQNTSISRRNLANPLLLGALYVQNDFSTLALKSCTLSTLMLVVSTFQPPRERFSERNPRPRLHWNSHCIKFRTSLSLHRWSRLLNSVVGVISVINVINFLLNKAFSCTKGAFPDGTYPTTD